MAVLYGLPCNLAIVGTNVEASYLGVLLFDVPLRSSQKLIVCVRLRTTEVKHF